MTIGQRIRRRRRAMDLTQQQACFLTGPTRHVSWWSGIENDRWEPNARSLRAIASALGCRAVDLMDDGE